MQRLMRAAIGTNNIDNCSRVCHSPTSFALRKSLGLSGATGSFADIDHADAAILIGANPTEGHPVVGARIKQAALRGMKLVTIDPRRIELADYGVAAPLAAPGHQRRGHARARARRPPRRARRPRLHRRAHRGLRRARASCSRRTRPDAVEEITGVPAADLERGRAHLRRGRRARCVLWGLGVTEHKYGSEVVQLICNLALMTGKVGRPASALLPLRGQNNVQGSSDMGALPDTYTALPLGRRRGGRAQRSRRAWGVPLSRARRAARSRRCSTPRSPATLKAMYIFGEDVAQTDPDTHHVVARARVARVPRLPGHLRDRDDEVRRRDPARVRVPREGRHVHERRAAHPARRAGDRPARRARRPTSRSSRRSRARSATRWATTSAEDVDGRDRAR